jgi:CheY-like chemotaxis protein
MLKTVTGILTPHFDVVAAVSDGKAAIAAAARTAPEVVLLDIVMPELDGFRTARELKQKQSHAKVVFLTAEEDDGYVSEALAVGARGYVVKRRLQSDLLPALHLAYTGHFFISPHAFIGRTNEDVVPPNGRTPGLATQEQKHKSNGHVMEFYSDESLFIRRMSEIAHTSLTADKLVIVLLKRNHLKSVSRQLLSSGIDLAGAIKWGDYRAFSVEAVAPVLLPNGRLDATRFTTFFDPLFARAALNSRKKCSGAVVLGTLATALLDLGYEHQNAICAEELWNALAQKHSCVVQCGCHLNRLDSTRNREALARICREHSRVIPIDQYSQSQFRAHPPHCINLADKAPAPDKR